MARRVARAAQAAAATCATRNEANAVWGTVAGATWHHFSRSLPLRACAARTFSASSQLGSHWPQQAQRSKSTAAVATASDHADAAPHASPHAPPSVATVAVPAAEPAVAVGMHVSADEALPKTGASARMRTFTGAYIGDSVVVPARAAGMPTLPPESRWTPRSAAIASVSVDRATRRLRVEWQPSSVSQAHAPDGDHGTNAFVDEFVAPWLRHNCPAFSAAGSGQRTMVAFEMIDPPSIVAAEAHPDGRGVHVVWEDGHHSDYEASWLARHSQTRAARRARDTATAAAKQVAQRVEAMSFADVMASEEALMQWMAIIARDGLAVLRGTPVDGESVAHNAVRTVAERVAPVMDTLYGTVFHVESTPSGGAVNIAYTDEMLELHQDLNYYESPPGIQLLHCVEFEESVVGGESVFLDAVAVAEEVRARDADAFHALSTLPVRFQKVHYARARPAHYTYDRPIIATDGAGGVVSVFWSPPFEGPVHLRPDDAERFYRGYAAFAEALRDAELASRLEFRLRPGDLVAFNNRRMLHGRRRFAGGKRHLTGTYLNIDDFKSRLAHLRETLGGGDDAGALPVAHVANQDCT